MLFRGKNKGKKRGTGKTAVKAQKSAVAHKNASAKQTPTQKQKKVTECGMTNKRTSQVGNLYTNEKGEVFKVVPVEVKMHRDNKGNHYHVILEDIGKNHVSVGLSTHRQKRANGKKGGNNKLLQKDTLDVGQKNYKPKAPTYMRRQGEVDIQDNYYDKKKGSMTEEDYAVAKKYGNLAKEKFLNKKRVMTGAKHVNQSPSAIRRKRPVCYSHDKVTKTKSNVKKNTKRSKRK